MPMKSHYAFGVFVALISVNQTLAETNSNTQNDVSDPVIVVTATRTEQRLDESPVPISVIQSAEIKETGATQLHELLSHFPGLELNDIHGQQGQSIMMQGMDSQHVLIMIDSVPVSQTSTEINLERFSLNNIERIEIAPGASSALYGSSAMGGVINLITKVHKEPYFEGSIATKQTETDTQNWPTQLNTSLQAGHNIGDGFIDHSLSVTHYSGVNTDESYEEQVASGYRWNLNERLQFGSYTAKATWMAGLLERPYLTQRGNNSLKSIKQEDSHEFATSLQRQTVLSEQLLQLDYDGYHTIQDILNRDDDNDLNRKASALSTRATSQWNSQLFDHQLIFGTSFSAETLEQTKKENGEEIEEVPSDADRQSVEGFLQDDWAPLPGVNIVSGIRTQWDSDFDWFTAPKIAARWDAWQGSSAELYIRASAGMGYRVPSLKERYYRFDHSNLGYVVEGNPDLNPETSLNIQAEIGGNIQLGSSLLNWSINGYQQKVKNLVETFLDEDAGTSYETYIYGNIGSALIQGIELNAGLPLSIGNHTFENSVSYQYLYAIDEDNDFRLEKRPEHKFILKQRLALDAPGKPVLTMKYIASGEQISDYEDQSRAEAFLLVNSYLQLTLSPRWQLQLSGENLTDQIADSTNTVMPVYGRTWSVSLNYKTY